MNSKQNFSLILGAIAMLIVTFGVNNTIHRLGTSGMVIIAFEYFGVIAATLCAFFAMSKLKG